MLKGFDGSLQMNAFTLHDHRGIICLLRSKHPAVTLGRGKYANIYTTDPSRPQRPDRLDNHPSSHQHQKAISLKNLHALHYSMLFMKMAFQIKLRW